MCDVSRFGLKEEKQIAVLLGFVVVREEAFLNVTGILKMTRNFILLSRVSFASVNEGSHAVPLPVPCDSGSAVLF